MNRDELERVRIREETVMGSEPTNGRRSVPDLALRPVFQPMGEQYDGEVPVRAADGPLEGQWVRLRERQLKVGGEYRFSEVRPSVIDDTAG